MVLVHADEACLGNGREAPTPGGAGGLVEVRTGAGVARRDYFVSEPDTTNNRMALRSAIEALALLAAKGPRRVRFVSDSQYLVRGMAEWVRAWRARGWRRQGGAIENLELWRELVAAAERHAVTWVWVRGHAGHVKNEYANHLATRAAAEQHDSGGLVPSGLEAWLAAERAAGRYRDYDPDADVPRVDKGEGPA